jgi:hypothetical protein
MYFNTSLFWYQGKYITIGLLKVVWMSNILNYYLSKARTEKWCDLSRFNHYVVFSVSLKSHINSAFNFDIHCQSKCKRFLLIHFRKWEKKYTVKINISWIWFHNPCFQCFSWERKSQGSIVAMLSSILACL